MRYWLVLSTLILMTGDVLPAQEYDRPNHAERARPSLDPEWNGREGKWDGRPWLSSASRDWSNWYYVNRNVIDEPSGNQAPQNESSIAVNPVDPRYLISSAVDGRTGAFVYVSSDGGRTWRNKNLGIVRPNWISGNDPSVGWDHRGVAYLMYGAFPPFTVGKGGQSGIYIARSTDNGETWQAHIPVIEHVGQMTADSAFEDKYYIHIDNSATSPYRGYMYTPWKRVVDRDSATQIIMSRSIDGGSTWSTPVPVSPRKSGTSLDTTFGQSFPLISSGPDGTVYVVWNDGPMRSIGFARSTDAGLTWSQPYYIVQSYPTFGTARAVDGSVYHVLKGTFRAESYPTLAVDNSPSTRSGTLYLCWAAGTYPDVYFQKSTDKGMSWSTPRVFHSETRGDQWWPWISVDQTNGDIAVMYSDSRDDPDNILVDQYISYSADGGESWIDRRATDVRSDFRDNPYTGRIFAGDYSGNAFHAGKIYPSYLDTRGDNDVYTSLVDIRKPAPVDNLTVTSSLDGRDMAHLSWSYANGATSLFGKPLASLSFVVYRDGSEIAVLPENARSYDDSGLSVDTLYSYDIVVASGADTSALRNVCYVPRDLLRPLGPTINRYDKFVPSLSIDLGLPTRRGDSVSPLENLASITLYRDGIAITTRSLAATDTGMTVTLTDQPPARGYYRYWATVSDGSTPPNVSVNSEAVIAYVGSFDPYLETFDSEPPRFLNDSLWGLTSTLAVSGTQSWTDSPEGDYKSRVNTSSWIWPVVANGPIELHFNTIAIVDRGDSALTEVSYDSGRSWSVLAIYRLTDQPAWSDRIADAGDWLPIRQLIDPGTSPVLVLIRFRLQTSALNNADGWYIDDVEFGRHSSVPDGANSPDRALSLYPNPARETVILRGRFPGPRDVEIIVIDLFGREVMHASGEAESDGSFKRTLDLQLLPAGAYVVQVSAGDQRLRSRMVIHR